jgi:hypothetical protein
LTLSSSTLQVFSLSIYYIIFAAFLTCMHAWFLFYLYIISKFCMTSYK